ncbi:glycoside hydrolase family 97 protein [Fulvivirga sedimenti]|uniref:Glycoside hydrolase family 97 protein n=1 Tax=Fulvivirga sedimenti TaxID=2879465 RepID=A0A9X1HMG6_9BACT|nr:glycoside hydrolase family 97 protein [Fulvivirga sedimenti]MCA6074141.1 glycoside hydrolase family 97 protein [Fulvivirga sedimenti]
MKKSIYLIILVWLVWSCSESETNTPLAVSSPDGRNEVIFQIINGKPAYRVFHDNSVVIDTSFMSFEIRGAGILGSNVEISDQQARPFTEIWEMPWGEQRKVENTYNELSIELRENSPTPRTFRVIFRVYDDGLGFRYHFPEQENLSEVIIESELTEFNLTSDPMVWWIPGDWDIYEHLYNTTRFSKIDATSKRNHPNLAQTYIPYNAVNTPVTMKTDDGLYLNFHEANLTDYSDMTLRIDSLELKMVSELVGSEITGYKVKRNTPFDTPWRTIQIADRAGDLIESNLIVNLNEPNKLGDVSWFTPMKYVGIWWEMHMGTRTWDYASGNHGATTEHAKELIDFAAENNIGGLLVEGWNTGWERWIGFPDREGVFDFITPYPDYDLREVVLYGDKKGVQLIMHHETSAAPRTYDQQMDTAYALMESLGIHSVKTGYVGKIIPEGEYHHGQWMVNHYRRALEKGAAHQIAINAHEPIKDTGIRRTLPNAISREGLRGQEFNAWASDGGNPPEHLPIVAFTRMLAGPIDFTPGIFNISLDPHKPDNQINTTLAHQLGLYVVIYSPIQMAADLIENYEGVNTFQFIRDVGVDWEQSKVLDGEVGDFVVIAREERNTGNWFVGGIADENGKETTVAFDFLPEGETFMASIYRDSPNAHFRDNPTACDITSQEIKKGDELDIRMAPGGGFAISLLKK